MNLLVLVLFLVSLVAVLVAAGFVIVVALGRK